VRTGKKGELLFEAEDESELIKHLGIVAEALQKAIVRLRKAEIIIRGY
jgi:hypothetical protein